MAVLWLPGNCPPMPEITDERLSAMMENLEPVYEHEQSLWTMQPVDPRTTSIHWDPKPVRDVGRFEHLHELLRIETNHKCGYVMFFKPSIAEVLSQVQDNEGLINGTGYGGMGRGPARYFQVLGDDHVAAYSQGDGHRTVTIFYEVL